MSNLFSAGSSKARRLSALSTLAVSALLFSACASENSTAQSSSSATSSASASANASSTQSSSAAGAQASSSRSSDQGASDASPSAGAETTSSDGQKLEEIYTGAEDMKKASPVPTDNSEVKKTTELVNSYENILSTVKPAPSAAASPEATSDEDSQEQNVEKARAVLDEDTIHAIENISVDSAAAEFAVQASEYAMAGWHYEGSSTVVGTPRMADTQYKGQPARLLEVCMDSSSVKIYDENNQPVKDDSSPKRSLNIYTLVQVNGQWKIATHDFPNNPDC